MSYEENLRSFTADADSSIGIYTGVPGMPGSADPNYGKQYCAVKITGAHQVGLATAATHEVIVGVLQNKPQRTGEAATVAYQGITNMMSGAAITAGAAIKVDSSGRAVTATVGTDPYFGIALGSCTAINQLVPVLLMKPSL